MITPKTQAAIAVLNDIYAGESTVLTDECHLSEEERCVLLFKLTAAGLIRLSDHESPQNLLSYRLTRRPSEITLLDILEATGEHLNCNHPTTEYFYIRYGKAAQKLGVVNQITRTYLQDITLSEL